VGLNQSSRISDGLVLKKYLIKFLKVTIKNKGKNQLKYSPIIESFMYIITYLISKLNRFTNSSRVDNWKAIRISNQIFEVHRRLYYTGYPTILEEYNDVNWIFDTKELKSTSEYIFTLGGAVMSWKFSKQTCVARSMIESKFIDLGKAWGKAEWL
jgi:hypothetical protein